MLYDDQTVTFYMWRMNLLILNLHNLDSLYCPLYWQGKSIFEPLHDKMNKMACAPCEDSDQPGHPSSRIRVFTVLIG